MGNPQWNAPGRTVPWRPKDMEDAPASGPDDAVVGRPKEDRDTVLKPPPVLGRPEGSGFDASSSSNALRDRNIWLGLFL